ncbi:MULTISPECIES: hypothetical protein [unclassified Pseudomonas]|uniref:DUF6929 family protein n=1 Tax=unclassified Pseudomonas TaxID=196821 RepID=UPI002449E959|nr:MULTISPECIES: hypothetical protein [unclassified Pseudomonas]MDG9921957.1 hypothetical protein [Pseudomonas sp. GD04045]MDH0033950.1 hypothetical protein [Pseudomonas sp. GD04019]
MSQPKLLRTLVLDPVAHPLGQAHLSAASALVRVDERLYVVADDELHLGLFSLADDQPGQLVRLFEGELPAPKAERKAAKPDLEALALLPALPGHARGALLALGSGSKANRQRAVLLGLEQDAQPALIDLTPLYQPLLAHFADLNIEGGFLLGEEFLLLQRGNQGQAANAAVRYRWVELRDWLLGEGPLPPPTIQPVELGELGIVALGFTDGAALADGRWLFSAAAENTADSYNDGACLGAVIGLVERDGRVRRLAELDGRWKVEGIALDEAGDLLLVTDADDPATAASLLHLPLSGLLG